jgi:starch phosphorylase
VQTVARTAAPNGARMSVAPRSTTHDRSAGDTRLRAVLQTAPRIAYFSMEIALEAGLPTYSGGLGILAGDMLRSSADLGLPIVGVMLAYHRGYFVQHLDTHGNQRESPEVWDPRTRMTRVDRTVRVEVEGRQVLVGAWRYDLLGSSGHVVPIYLLDTDLDGNEPRDRDLSGSLYGGDHRYRLAQETVLGFGGFAMLDALGFADGIGTFHMNEGHAAFLVPAAVEALAAARGQGEPTSDDFGRARKRFVFTTHTPVPAGHDRFDTALTLSVLGEARTRLVERLGAVRDGSLNMTQLALRGSHYVNAVAMRHGEVSRALFPGDSIAAITNGVHAGRWTAPAFALLFDRYLPAWRRDNGYLRHAVGIPLEDVWAAHRAAKDDLFVDVKRRSGVTLERSVFTIGFARRAAEYKRGYLPFWDVERLRALVESAGPIQFIYAGKAHPQDAEGKAVIRRVFEAAERLGGALRVVYLENYEISVAQRLVAGVDLWLNTPRPPLEASGTSGMKAALNGVPSLSTLDGWWVEGCLEGQTGWAIESEPGANGEEENAADAARLYAKLESAILPLYYGDSEGYGRVMRGAIAFNGSYFNTQRSVEQYVRSAYSELGGPYAESGRPADSKLS